MNARWSVAARRLGLLLALALSALPAYAGDLRWWCWDDPPSYFIRCRLDPASTLATGDAPDPETERLAEILPRNMPRVARMLRLRPADFAGYTVSIPLWGPAFDMKFVAALATGVMCGSRQECRVDFLSAPPRGEWQNAGM